MINLEAGDCDENNYGGSTVHDLNSSTLNIYIPIDNCNLDNIRYDSPKSNRKRRSAGLFQASARVTLAEIYDNGLIIAAKTWEISAECGKETL